WEERLVNQRCNVQCTLPYSILQRVTPLGGDQTKNLGKSLKASLSTFFCLLCGGERERRLTRTLERRGRRSPPNRGKPYQLARKFVPNDKLSRPCFSPSTFLIHLL